MQPPAQAHGPGEPCGDTNMLQNPKKKHAAFSFQENILILQSDSKGLLAKWSWEVPKGSRQSSVVPSKAMLV